MKTKYFLLLLVAIGIISPIACNHKSKQKLKAKLQLTRLRQKDIYNKQLVDVLIFNIKKKKEDSLIAKGKKLFNAAADLFSNKKDTAALRLFKQSIMTFPDPDAYYHIGLVLLDMQDNAKLKDKTTELNEAIQALEMAEYLKYDPVSYVYYNLACADNMLVKCDSISGKISGIDYNNAIYNLGRAFKNGYVDTLSMQNDGRISAIMQTDEYSQMIEALRAKNNFESFKLSFIPLNLPFTINYDNVGPGSLQIDYDFAKFIPSMEGSEFSRGVHDDYYAVGELAETPNYVALIYTSTQFYDGPDDNGFQPISTYLITYAPDGTQIDQLVISGQSDLNSCTGVTIDSNLITMQNYKLTYKYPQDSIDSYNNEKIELQDQLEQAGNKSDSISARLDTLEARITHNVLLDAKPDTKTYYKLLATGKLQQVTDTGKGKVTMR